MYGVIFLIVLGFVWIIFASVQDLKNKEVANWLNFSLIIFALGFRFFYSLFYRGGFSFFYQGLIGLGIFFVLGNLLYYGRMFAGGDAKLMIAMGAVLPFSESFLII
ncbi:MAG: prepilin peptidase [Nanoarchaeota archaeon]|nr:prepilin peptidase [Nanoarchaeota archaeon]